MIGTQGEGRNQEEPSKMIDYSRRRGAKHLAENEGFKLKEKNGSVLLQTHREQVFKKGSSYQIHLTNFPFSGALKRAAEKGQNAISWKVTSLDPCAFLYSHPLPLYYLSLFFLFM